MKWNNKLKATVDTFGKDKGDFFNALYERFDTDTYGLWDDEGSEGHVGSGEDYIWEEYLNFLQNNPQYQNQDYNAFFDLFEKQPKQVEQAKPENPLGKTFIAKDDDEKIPF